MTSSTSIFFTGATGFIGGAFLHKLLKRANGYTITALVREESKAKALQALGVRTVIGDLDSIDLLTTESSQADVVIHCAHADHVAGARAIIAGLEKRGSQNGRKPLLLHTSGSGVLIDYKYKGVLHDKVFDESTLGVMEGHPKDSLHRDVELDVLKAGQDGKIDIAIVSPPMIYGASDGLALRSQQVPLLIKAAIKNKQTYYVGAGLNEWNNVHIEDLSDFYVILFEKLMQGTANVNNDAYYFAENGRNNLKEICDRIAVSLRKQGGESYSDTAKSAADKDEEILGKFGVIGTGYNSRHVTTKAKSMGWKPTRTSLLDSIDDEVAFWLQQK